VPVRGGGDRGRGRLRPDDGGQAAQSLLELFRPSLDFTALARGMGVPASRAATAAEFAQQLRRALAEPGPHLIEAIVPSLG
jgi:acetolactate synthase-1/2/3 large subunit